MIFPVVLRSAFPSFEKTFILVTFSQSFMVCMVGFHSLFFEEVLSLECTYIE